MDVSYFDISFHLQTTYRHFSIVPDNSPKDEQQVIM